MSIFLDGDFASNKGACKYHCSPSCHPGQTGDASGTEWFYGCRHMAWPQNRAHDFVPFVDCCGDTAKCDMRGEKFVAYYLRGLRARAANANKKVAAANSQIDELTKLIQEH